MIPFSEEVTARLDANAENSRLTEAASTFMRESTAQKY